MKQSCIRLHFPPRSVLLQIMHDFRYELPSQHSPEELWKALNTPFNGEVGKEVYPHVSITYENLDQRDGQIQVGTRIIGTPDREKLNFIPMIEEMIPTEVSVKTVDISQDRKRLDIFEPHQIISGKMLRRAEADQGNMGLLVVEGSIAIHGLNKFWPSSLLGDLDLVAATYLVRKPNEKIMELLPEILSS